MHESLASKDTAERARLDRLIRALRDRQSGDAGEQSGDTGERSADPTRRAAATIPGRAADDAPRAQPTADLPLSSAQQRLWFLDQLSPGRATYNMPAVLAMDGMLDRSALARAFDDVRARHQSLRSEIAEAGTTRQQPVQRILPTRARTLPVVDLGSLPSRRAERLASEIAGAQARRAFDLTRGPLLRVLVVHLAARRHHLIAVLHHIIADGWSIGVLLRDLELAYGARRQAQDPDWRPLRIPYGAVAQRQQHSAARQQRAADLAWWHQHLAGLEPMEVLPDLTAQHPPSERGHLRQLALGRALTRGLKGFARQQESTFFMVLAAAFAAVLGRLTDTTDVAMGTPVAGRDDGETHDQIGLFVNTLVLRVDLSASPSFRTLLQRTREATLGAFEHRTAPYDQLVAMLHAEQASDPADHDAPPPAPATADTVRVLLTLEAAPETPRLEGLAVSLDSVSTETAKFDLSLTVVDGGDTLDLRLVARADRYTADTTASILRLLRTLARDAIRRPEVPVTSLALLTASERRSLLRDWSRPRAADESEGARASVATNETPPLLHRMIAAQAARTPTAEAVVFLCAEPARDRARDEGARSAAAARRQVLTYEALLARARRLARHLANLGVGPGTVVSVALDRSPDLVVALTAVLEAGGAYLPLDPSHPSARLRGMVEDARARVVVTDTAYREKLTPTTGPATGSATAQAGAATARIVCVDRDAEAWRDLPADPVDAAVCADDLAYVIYTSGSTGTPKGVGISHRAIAERLAWVRQHDLDATSAFLQKTTISFDVSVAELFGPLVAGGRTVLPPPGAAQDTAALLRVIEDEGITHTSFPPTLLAAVLDEPEIGRRTRSLRTVITGGETVPPDLPERVARRMPGVVIENRYGPTEATISVSAWQCSRQEHGGSRAARLPIGRPIASAELYVVDRRLELVPAGVPGEILIGGTCLARGYLGRPAQTAAAFVPDPLSGKPGARLYRSGDLARWRHDGAIEFIGRRDAQVKLHGFRIELGEIERALRALPRVAQAAAALRTLRGRPRLVGFVVEGPRHPDANWPLDTDTFTDTSTGTSTGTFIGALAAVLPRHMIPEQFVVLDALPTAPTGKVDRRALDRLPLPEAAGGATDPANKRTPRTQEERWLVALFAEVLALDEPPGIDQSFFQLGGHSLLATSLMARIRSRLARDVPLRTLFEAPTPAALARAIAPTTPSSTDLTDVPSPNTSPTRPLLPPITAVPTDDPASRNHTATLRSPLSFAQERLWFLHQLEPASATYHVATGLRLRGPLKIIALRHAIRALVARHASLRTTFAEHDGVPEQIVREAPSAVAATSGLPVLDLSALAAGTRVDIEHLLRARLQAQARRPFDLARGPLLRATLVRLAPDHHLLVVVMHHIVADGWSIGILVHELSVLYRALSAAAVTSRVPRLPPLDLATLDLASIDLQVTDYARWQHRHLAGAELDRQLAYWRRQLAGAPEQLDLPTDHPRSGRRSGRGQTLDAELGGELVADVEALAAAHDATVFMTLLAAFQALLHRASGQDDIVVGSPIAGRTRTELEPLVGFFVSTLVLRADLGGTPSFGDLLAQVRTTTLEAYAHQDVPFEKLVESLGVTRDLTSTPLFQAMFVLQNAPRTAVDLGDVVLGEMPIDTGTAKFDLTLTAIESAADTSPASTPPAGTPPAGTPAGMRLRLEYATDRFEATTARRLLRHFEQLLAALVASPSKPIRTLPWMNAAERARMIDQVFAGPRLDASHDTLNAWIDAQLVRTPEHVALIAAGEPLTYAQLDARVARLAQHLRDLGVGREQTVGVSLERSPHLVVALLAILRAGGAYVPLDPAYPVDRLTFMLEDAGAVAVIVEEATAAALASANPSLRRVCVDDARHGPAQVMCQESIETRSITTQPVETQPVETRPEQLAYVIYTSGSTGRPKGVAITQGNAAALVTWAAQSFDAATFRRTFAATSISFDLSVFEIFVTLARGGTVVLGEHALALPAGPRTTALGSATPDQPEMGERDRAPTLINTVPSAAAELAQAGSVPASVKTICLAGEPLHRSLVETLYAIPTVERVLNLYGPSEDTTYSTWAEVPRTGGAPTLGRPVAGTSALVLDAALEPVPIAVRGELYLGGRGLARGYLGRPALTAARFVPNPFATTAGERLYRSGDLARFRNDGELLFLGRSDHQIKLRGFRIELGEIEAHLNSLDGIGEAAVIVHQPTPDNPQLVGFLTTADAVANNRRPNGTTKTDSDAVRRALAATLPAYMVPAFLAWLPAMPHLPNGKLDRRRLAEQAPEALARQAAAEVSAGERPSGTVPSRPTQSETAEPETATERILAEIWQDALGISPIGRHDVFFELGGHSLLATRVLSRIRQRFRVTLPLRTLFESPTLKGLARAVDAAEASPSAKEPPADRSHDTHHLPPIAATVSSAGSNDVSGATDRTVRDRAPLSLAQERLWFLHRLEPESAAYHIPAALRLRGALNLDALRRAFEAVSARHASLRTTFVERHGVAEQVVHENLSIPLPVIDLMADSDHEHHAADRLPLDREHVVRTIAKSHARKPFDLARGPLLRATVIRLDHGHHILAVVMHHIVSDGWSVAVMVRELSAFYRAFAAGEPAPLTLSKPLAIQVTDHARWQRRHLVGEALEQQLAYWRQQLEGAPPQLDLPTDRPRPARRSDHGGVVEAELDGDLVARLEALASHRGATLFMVLLASFQAFLHRHTGHQDIVVGSPVAGRNRVELEPLIGFFVSTLVLRANLADAPTFDALLAQARNTTLDAYAHQDVPFEKLVDDLGVPRDLASTPLFQAMLVLQNAPPAALDLGDLEVEELTTESASAAFDLTLTAIEVSATDHRDGDAVHLERSQPGKRLRLRLEYSVDLFTAATAHRMLRRLAVLLRAVVDDPEQPVGALPVMSSHEQRAIISWNRTQATFDGDTTLVAMLGSQAARTPDQLAVVFDDGQQRQVTLSYGTLWRRAGRLAQTLAAHGIGPDRLVGLCAERSPELVIGLVAILRAGGAYLPLDPTYPADRLAMMVADSSTTVALVQPHLRARVSHASFQDSGLRPGRLEIIPLTPEAGEARRGKVEHGEGKHGGAGVSAAVLARAATVDPAHLAYTIFTSGSTGRPKGVMITQGAVVNHLRWLQEADPLGAGDRMLQKTPTSFDASVFELFWPLTTGATLVLARPDGRQDSTYLAELIRRQAITVVTCVPSLLDALLSEAGFRDSQHLRAVSCGGETLSPELVARFHTQFPDLALVNFYGPTEATIEATAWPLTRDPGGHSRQQRVPIGLPVANTEIRVLDTNMRPTPIGVTGELLIGGAQLARGYQQRPALTAARFLPHPDPDQPGERLYASGDRACWRAEDDGDQGALDFLGRIDDQVKIRGHRIELGEIEHGLLGHPRLREAAVVADDDRLVAFVVPEEGSETGTAPPDADALAAHLATRLPAYMVPVAWVTLDTLPLAPTGKVDRQALPLPDRAAAAAEGEAPRTALEQQVADAMAKTLGLAAEPLARDADFFAVGGHSLLATRLVAALHERFGVEIPLARLFETPTAAGLAAVIAEQDSRTGSSIRNGGAAEAAPPLRPRDPDQAPPLSFAQERLWFLDRLAPGNPWYNVPSAVRLDGTLDIAALHQALGDLVARHESLRTTFPARDGQPYSHLHPAHAPAARVPIALVDVSALGTSAAASSAAARTLARHRFDLAAGPLLRVALIRQAPAMHILVLVLHHIVADEWSTGIMVRELATGYRRSQIDPDQPDPDQRDAPALPIQLGDHAAWQRAWLRGAVLDTQLAYWRQHLAGIPPRIELATDYDHAGRSTTGSDTKDGASARGAQRAHSLPTATAATVRAFGRARGVTLFMSFVAAWSAVLSRMSGQRTVVVGTPLANREQVATQRLIGFLVNTLPLRIDVDPWAGFDALVDQVRTVVLGAQRHQHVPFDRIVQAVTAERARDHSPVFQVMLAMQTPGTESSGTESSGLGPIRLPGLALSPVPIPLAVSKFEMTLSVIDHEEAIDLRLAYQTDRFTAATADRILDQVIRFLDGAMADAKRPIAYDDALGDKERARILGPWRRAALPRLDGTAERADTDSLADRPRLLHHLVAVQAARTPAAIAVVYAGGPTEATERLDYQALMARAQRLAHHLRARGVGPDRIVGVALARSPALVVALLAVLEAGGAYLPLDPDEPAARIVFKLQDAAAGLLITSTRDQPEGSREWADADDGRRIVRIDRELADREAEDAVPAVNRPGVARPGVALDRSKLVPSNLAYVIYTSGSTGHPKGVAVSHRAVAERLAWVAAHELDASCAFLQKTTISFDVSVAEIFAPLVAGGRTVLPPAGAAGDTDLLLRLIEAEGITHTSFPPTLLAALLDEPDIATRTRSLKSIVTGGETVPPSLPGRVTERLGNVLLENRYGPTETTISVTAWPCRAPLARDASNSPQDRVVTDVARALPIGRPIAAAEIHVVNAALEPVPIGAPGEIVIGGSCVARGYHGHPGRTAEAFVPNPFAGDDRNDDRSNTRQGGSGTGGDGFGARLYRTGDLGRWRSDGALEFLGRRDAQIKIRGFRVELGEIDASLATIAGVREAAVVDLPAPDAAPDTPTGSGDRLLVAYLTCDAELDLDSVRTAAAELLPRHQIPAAFIVIDQLPTSPTGKVDREALRQRGLPQALDGGGDEVGATGLGGPPRGDTETIIAGIWAELLRIETIGRRDDFFVRGGHSLLATRVMARLRDVLDVDLPLRALFASPTVAALAAVVDAQRSADLSDPHQESTDLRPPPLRPYARPANTPPPPAPLSPAQERLWFLDRLAPGSDLYNMPMVRRLRGRLHVVALQSALERVVHRHEALRTTFDLDARPAAGTGLPVQHVSTPAPVPLPLVDLRGHAAADAEALARDLAHRESRRPFDLSIGPMLRARLLRAADDEHWLTLVVHHIVGDEWSMRVLAHELAAAYGSAATGGAVTGEAATLPPITLHQSDVARWQRDWFQGSVLDRQLAYWRERLANAPEALALATDRPRPALESHAGASVHAFLPVATRERLDRFARTAGATRFMVLLAAFSALLARHARQETVVIGTPIALRDRSELHHVIGFLLNTVPLRLDLGDDPSFSQLVARARGVLLDAASHQDVPFERLVQELTPRRDLGRSPIFQAMLIVGHEDGSGPVQSDTFQSSDPLALPGLAVDGIVQPTTTAKVELTLGAYPDAGRLRLGLEYKTDLFDPRTAENLLAQLQTLIEVALTDPQRPVLTLPLVADAERAALQALGTGPHSPHAASSLPALFAQQAERSPTAEAVRDSESITLRYDQLAARVDQLACRLVDAGLKRETRVGIYLTRGVDLVVAALAVLRAGGTYVPLDPAFPRERLTFIATDAGVRLVVTDRVFLDTLPTDDVAPIVLERTHADAERADARSASLPPMPDPDQAAYQIYTSGSTGRPKGVAVSHGALANFLRAMAQEPGLAAGETLLAVTTLSFDIAALELFLPLIVGGRAVIASREEAVDGPRIAALLDAHAVDVLQATAATWRLLLTTGWRGHAGLRMLCGGEPLPADLASSLLATQGSAARQPSAHRPAAHRSVTSVDEEVPQLWNLYGPTETTVWSTLTAIAPGEAIAIGRPIDATETWVIDGAGMLAAPGVPGELLIGGAGVARGYAGRPKLTAERFVPDSLGTTPGARLYRTGDLARWRSDGRLDCLGRIDHQLKIRGFRIEPGEIEAVLARHPAVHQAAVVAQDHGQGDQRLVAFLVGTDAGVMPSLQDSNPALIPDLISTLREQLPAYMVPTTFEILDHLPLTPNAKIDRLALARHPVRRRENGHGSEAASAEATGSLRGSGARASTATEKQIADIWRDVLGLDAVGVDDSFFELGGHSLLLAQVHTRLRAGLAAEATLDMVELFHFPTIRGLARHLDSLRRGDDSQRPSAPRHADAEARGRRARQRATRSESTGRDIAIIGMAGRFPGAADVDTLWQRLRAGNELLSRFDEQALLAAGVAPEVLALPNYVRAGALLEDADCFDASFFGYSPREAQIIDPQQRVFLECAWSALESAGYDVRRFPGRIGVFGGVGMNGYLLNLLAHPDLLEVVGPFQVMISNDKDYLPTRVSYKLGLTGPGVAIQTACSTSLVAISFACDALLEERAEMILAGGVTVHPSAVRPTGYRYEAGGIQSPDGRTRSFDAASKGTVASSAAGIVLLKRLEDAVADGDTIRAVIKGWAINNDGADKIGFTAPSVTGQADVIAEAVAAAGVAPSSIGYVEAHGTGTPLGDPIELAALNRAFTAAPWTPRSCAIGSIKSNLGHTDAAAGVCGVIKTVLALEHGEIPPSLFFDTPNPQIDFDAGPFFVADQLRPWPTPPSAEPDAPRRAGVSALGIGGTNAHIVLESAPRLVEPASPAEPETPELLVWSARTAAARDTATANLAAYFLAPARGPAAHGITLADAASTLQTGRRVFPYRRFTVAEGWRDAARALDDPQRTAERQQSADDRPVVFLFPGGGAQHPGMGRALYRHEPVYRQEIDRVAALFARCLDHDPRSVLFPGLATDDGDRPETVETVRQESARKLRRPSYGLPALFATELALARLWQAWGVTPAAVIGHSLGEYTAAVIAGVLSLEDAVALVAERGVLFETLPKGAMLSVALGAEALRAYFGDGRDDDLADDMAVAAANTPTMSVASGPIGAIEALGARLESDGIDATRIHIDVAAHSPMVDGILEPFSRVTRAITPKAPTLPLISNVTGIWMTDDEASEASYWPRHLRATVRFADGLGTLLAPDSPIGPNPVLLEVGPGHTLATLARQHPANQHPANQHPATQGRADLAAAGIVSSLRPPSRSTREPANDLHDLLDGLGRLWLAGAEIDWPCFQSRPRNDTPGAREAAASTRTAGKPRRVPLPTYPFERTRHWVDPPAGTTLTSLATRSASRGGDRNEGGDGLTATHLALRPDTATDATPTSDSVAPTPPRDDLERVLLAIWRRLLGNDSIGIFDDFFELGGSSLLAIRLRAQMSQALGCDVAPHLVLEAATVARLAARLRQEGLAGEPAAGAVVPASEASPIGTPATDHASGVPGSTPNLVPLQQGTSPPLFLVHPVGGHVFFYRDLARALGPEWTVLGLRAQGTEAGETPIDDLSRIAARYVEQIRVAQPRGPYRLGGSSMGGNIAYEMAHQLRTAGARVELLALLDSVGPEEMPARPTDDVGLFQFLLRDQLPVDAETLRAMDANEQVRAVLDAASRHGMLPPDLRQEDLARNLTLVRAHLTALFDHTYRRYEGSALYFRAADRRPGDPPHPELSWIDLAGGGIEIHVVPGDHISMHARPHLPVLADHLRTALQRLI